jgi:hypothetical protein
MVESALMQHLRECETVKFGVKQSDGTETSFTYGGPRTDMRQAARQALVDGDRNLTYG